MPFKNRDDYNEWKKNRYYANHVYELERAKQYRDENKDKILNKMKTKITCECGVEIAYSHKSQHIKTQKHKSKTEAKFN